MIVSDILHKLKDINTNAPILFKSNDGGWSNIDIDISKDGCIYILADDNSPFSDE
jgi:hypothetical protein